MNTLSAWFSMGGYYAYVWSAYGLVLSVMLVNYLLIKKQSIQIRQRVTRWLKRNA